LAPVASANTRAYGVLTESSVTAKAADAARAAAASAANAAASAATARSYAAYAASKAASAAGYASDADLAVWDAVRLDCNGIADRHATLSARLWPDGYNPLRKSWQDTQAHFAGHSDHPWSFWLDWYQRLLDGTEDRWDLLTDIALLDKDAEGNDLWQDSENLAAEIARLEAEYAAKETPAAPTVEDAPLAEVIAATPNAERVEYAPKKEAIHTVPLSDLPVDHLQDALDRLTDASEVFGPPDGFNNQYLALIPDIDKLRRALDRYAKRPLRLHDVAADLSARLDNRIRNGECPETEKDALVASYKADLAGAMVDLQAHDPRVVEAVKARLTHGVDSVEDEDIEVIEAGVAAAAKISDEVLRAELLEDLATIKDPHASPEEGRQAIYRLGSRLPRILWVYRKESVEAFLKVTGVGQALEWSVSIIIRLFTSGG